MTRQSEFDDDDAARGRRPWRTDQEWHRLSERIDTGNEPPGTVRRSRWYAAAAAAVILAVAGRMLVLFHRPSAVEPRTVATLAGERLAIRLGDGSLVTLGPSTTVHYIANENTRTVELDGLAAFDVVHDASRAFVVRAGSSTTKDIGTSFVVRAYRADSVVTVAVTAGAVSLAGANGRPIDVRAGNSARVSPAGNAERDGTASLESATAWVDGRLAFDNVALSRVAADLARWFNVDVAIADPSLARRPLTAVYNHPTLDGVLDAIAASLDATWQRNGRAVVIRSRRHS